MRYKKITISIKLMEDILKGNLNTCKVSGLPEDFKVRRVNDYDGFGDTFSVVIESDSFPELTEGQIIPVIAPTYKMEVN